MANYDGRVTCDVTSVQIDVVNQGELIELVQNWAKNRLSRYVCVVNVHSIVTCSSDSSLRNAVRGCDIAIPDGAPVAWMLRQSGYPLQQRVSGPDFMEEYCRVTANTEQSIFLYGGTENVLKKLAEKLKDKYPDLKIAGWYSPPFRALSSEEKNNVIDMINRSGAGVVWVGLGCPKQEVWMAENFNKIKSVLVGVGAAFDFISDEKPRAPAWMRNHALEWLHRLMSEPGRLWKRYLYTNTVFFIKASAQIIKGK